MRLLLALLLFVPLAARADVSTLIADKGLAGARADLEARATLAPEDRFALGGVIFLHAVEKAYQTRWRYGLSAGDVPVPILRAGLPPNPTPEPLAAETVAGIFDAFLVDMTAADAVLDAIPADADPAVELRLPDLWFDIDGDGRRGASEDFVAIALGSLMTDWQARRMREDAAAQGRPDPTTATIRFDRADVHWLRAYTRVLAGISELVLAFDPTPQIADLLAFRAAIDDQFPPRDPTGGLSPERLEQLRRLARQADPDATEAEIERRVAEFAAMEARMSDGRAGMGGMARNFAGWADIVAVMINTLRNEPDPDRIGRARDHFLAMVSQNRRFWAEVAVEIDDDREWIPNGRQTAVLGFDMPGGVDDAWLGVLADADRMLRGELLIPYWRFGPGWGVDLSAWIDDPAPVNVIDWIQGQAAMPYAREGEIMSGESWRQFQRLVRGQTGLFVVLLN